MFKKICILLGVFIISITLLYMKYEKNYNEKNQYFFIFRDEMKEKYPKITQMGASAPTPTLYIYVVMDGTLNFNEVEEILKDIVNMPKEVIEEFKRNKVGEIGGVTISFYKTELNDDEFYEFSNRIAGTKTKNVNEMESLREVELWGLIYNGKYQGEYTPRFD